MSWRTPENLSADEIAVLLGYANAAAMVAAIGQYCVAGGTTNAYTATPAIPWTSYSDGDRITVRVPNFVNTGPSTMDVSGLGTRNIYKMSQGSSVLLTGFELYYGHMATLVYSSLGSCFILESSFSLRAADIPSTLNATTIGDITLSGSGTVTIANESGNLALAGNASQSIRLKLGSTTVSTIGVNGLIVSGAPISVGTSFTTVYNLYYGQSTIFVTVNGKGTILLDWDGTTLTKVTGPASLVIAGSAGAGETAFRVSGGNLQAIVDTGTRSISVGLVIGI